MKFLRALIVRLCGLFRQKQQDREFAEEMESHLAMHVEDNLHSGMSPEEARRNALIKLGGMDRTYEECRDRQGFRWLDELRQDLCYAFRILTKSPGFLFVAILMLALGIGANAAIASIMDALIFRSMPFAQIDRLVAMPPGLNYLNYLDIRTDNSVFTNVSAVMELPVSGRAADSTLLKGRAVSANFFKVVGLPMTLGRGFLPDEEKLFGSHPVAVISYRYWKRKLEGDPAILGETIKINDELLTVVGVAPRDLLGDLSASGEYFDLWVPIPILAKIVGVYNTPMWRDATENRNTDPFLQVVGRLKPDVTLEQAKAWLNTFIANHQKAYPGAIKNEERPMIVPMNKARWPKGELFFLSIVLAAASVCILLITCTNIAGLLLARGSVRQREIATRLALGASRGRVVRQLLAEGFALSALAMILSLLIYKFVLHLFFAFNPLNGSELYADLSINYRTLLFTAAIGLLATLIFGLAPALAITRTELSGSLKDQGFLNFNISKARLRRVLVVSQIILTVVLLIGAGLFGRTVRHFLSSDHGFDRNALIVSHSEDQYNPDRTGNMVFFARCVSGLLRFQSSNLLVGDW